MKTISGRLINIKSNKNKRTYTIRTLSSKYRTHKMSKEEFENAYFWTANDWQQFLNATEEYYIV